MFHFSSQGSKQNFCLVVAAGTSIKSIFRLTLG
jgi:hypothetical protein